jgi:hypothetical protein
MLIKEFKEKFGISDDAFKRATKTLCQQLKCTRDDLIRVEGKNHTIIELEEYKNILGISEPAQIVFDIETIDNPPYETVTTAIVPSFQSQTLAFKVDQIDYSSAIAQVSQNLGDGVFGLQDSLYETMKNSTRTAIVQGHLEGLIEGSQLAAQITPDTLGKFAKKVIGKNA